MEVLNPFSHDLVYSFSNAIKVFNFFIENVSDNDIPRNEEDKANFLFEIKPKLLKKILEQRKN